MENSRGLSLEDTAATLSRTSSPNFYTFYPSTREGHTKAAQRRSDGVHPRNFGVKLGRFVAAESAITMKQSQHEIGRRDFIKSGALAGLGVGIAALTGTADASVPPQPRIRRYAALGRTGMRISDISFGADRLSPGPGRPGTARP